MKIGRYPCQRDMDTGPKPVVPWVLYTFVHDKSRFFFGDVDTLDSESMYTGQAGVHFVRFSVAVRGH